MANIPSDQSRVKPNPSRHKVILARFEPPVCFACQSTDVVFVVSYWDRQKPMQDHVDKKGHHYPCPNACVRSCFEHIAQALVQVVQLISKPDIKEQV